MADDQTQDGPHRVDRHVGARVRLRRKSVGISQEQLANALGVTFQQVQKYERGTNRISASKLFETGRALGAPVAYFFEGLSPEAEDRAAGSDAGVDAFLLTPEGIELAGAFPRLPPAQRRRVLELVQTLVDPD